MALHDTNMDSDFLAADHPGDDYQPKTDLATEYFNTFNQICDNYREEPLRSTSDSLRLTTEILDSVRECDNVPEYVTTDFSERFLREEQVFQFGQPDASALLRHRARRRFNEEHGLPAVTSQESGVSCLRVIIVFQWTRRVTVKYSCRSTAMVRTLHDCGDNYHLCYLK